jgi:tetratricopeptide (TPR) repeat protein
VPDLKVIARTSSFAFKGKAMDVREIGRRLGAANLLEGSVQQDGDRVRISVQLIRARDGAHLWAEKYDRKLADVFAIQDEIASHVTQALELALPDAKRKQQQAADTTDVEAYREYLRGIALLPERNVQQMREGLGHFERAIALDPSYARAYTSASIALVLLAQYASISPDEVARGRRYAEKALELAPGLGEAHIAMGAQLERVGNFDAAVREYRQGVALSPGYALGQQWLGEVLFYWMGDQAGARAQFDKALALDPLSPVVRSMGLFSLAAMGEVGKARVIADAMIREAPKVARNYDSRSALFIQQGDLVSALRDFDSAARLDPQSYGFQVHRCYALLDFGALAEARACAARLQTQAPESQEVTLFGAYLASVEGRNEDALRIFDGQPNVGAWRRAFPLLQLGRPADVIAIYRKQEPALLKAAPSAFVFGSGMDAHALGSASYALGDHDRGRDLLHRVVELAAGWPRFAAIAGVGWIDVSALTAAGEIDQAIASLQKGTSEGVFLGIAQLDRDAMLAPLRADPRYEAIVAPARLKARREVDRARAAGLL